MKWFNKILFTILVFLCIPFYVYAESDSSGEQGGGAGIVNSCSPNCKGIQRSSSLAGVRITFVDANGKAVAASGGKSYDFETYVKPGKAGMNFTYNSNGGDRNKIAMAGGGNYGAGSMNESGLKKFSAVAAAYNAAATTYGAQVTTLNTSGNTGGNLTGMDKELSFFLSLTKKGLEPAKYAANVNAFITAIAEVTGGFNASELIYKIAEGCSSGDEIFIVMEPLFFWSGKVGGSYQNYFGSLSDSYHFFNGSIIGALSNTNNMAYLIYYEREIASFKGAKGVSKNGFPIQSGSDLLSTYGYGIAVDWANDPAGYCGSCTYENGKFAYDNKLYPGDLVIPSGFATIQDFAFTDRDKGGAGCCQLLESKLGTMPKEWQEAYNRLCKEDDKDCCTPDVPNTPVVIDVNNCCTDATESRVIESELDDLFCRDNELQVDFYKNRCNNEQFKTNLNEYCDLYCTERVVIEIPGAITATSGRYFKLTQTSHGTTSPYIDGYRRCRVKIYYDEWRERYVEKVQSQVDNFNEFQKQSSRKANYEDAIPTEQVISKNGTINVSCSETDNKGVTHHGTSSATFSYTYYKYTFENKHGYHTIKLNNNNYTRVEILNDKSDKVDHEPYSLYKYEEAKAAYDAAVSQAKSACKYANKSVGGDSFDEQNISYRSENPKEVLANEITPAITNAKGKYEAATKEAYELEQKIDFCDFYFDDTKTRLPESVTYIGKDAKANYEFSPDVLFRYSQVYLNEESQKALDTLQVEFDKSCEYETIYDSNETGVDEIKPDRYSGIYGTGAELMRDFKRDKAIAYEEHGIPMSSYYDHDYNAEKKYTTDAKYHAMCKWTEKSNPVYTLVPSGVASSDNSLVDNFTIHDREYRIYLSTFDGTYETYWDIDNIGHKGKLTDYFKNGKTCAAENPADVGTTMTCKIHVEHELVLTGKCNGSNGTETTINSDDCEKLNEGYDLFLFKIVDPSNFFPTGTNTDSGEIAKNWTGTDRGVEVMNEINTRANNGETYNPENISYSVTLTPTDMRHIKNYNAERESNNGYSDFNLHCDAVEEVQTNSMVDGKGVTKCKSYFIENLSKGVVHYGNQDHKVNVWSSSKTLEQIRQTNTNKNRW